MRQQSDRFPESASHRTVLVLALATLPVSACTIVVEPGGLNEAMAKHTACSVQRPESQRVAALHRNPRLPAFAGRTRGESFGADEVDAAEKAWRSLGPGSFDLLTPDLDSDRLLGEPPPTTRSGSDLAGRIYRQNVWRVGLLVAPNDSMGSGVLVEEPGLLLTNYHVVTGYPNVHVYFPPEPGEKLQQEDWLAATVVAADPRKDLALVKLDDPDGSKPPARLGTFSSISVGSQVFAIGHPKGLFWSFTAGVVSQIRPNYTWAYDVLTSHEATVVQTQTPINPGNSGGPLFNDDGELIGINSFTKGDATGLNFAVAIDEVRQLLAKRPAPPAGSPEPTGKIDLDGDGRIDTVEFDRDADGRPDLWTHDFAADGKIDLVSVDMNYNGIPDVFLFDTNGDGVAEFHHHDGNEDGTIDFVAIDVNGDGKPDAGFEC
ncbi:MAG: trypsin-like peptidase domain-containing protein [Acidobacteriota bacterium]|nr:trypsin-like peptidase domain-containing protein [Acidobacteriota bacterium]